MRYRFTYNLEGIAQFTWGGFTVCPFNEWAQKSVGWESTHYKWRVGEETSKKCRNRGCAYRGYELEIDEDAEFNMEMVDWTVENVDS